MIFSFLVCLLKLFPFFLGNSVKLGKIDSKLAEITQLTFKAREKGLKLAIQLLYSSLIFPLPGMYFLCQFSEYNKTFFEHLQVLYSDSEFKAMVTKDS